MRLFLALEVPDGWRRAAEALSAALAERHEDALRFVRPELLHLTLRFLGEVEDRDVASLQSRLGEAIAPFELPLELGGVSTFGSPARTNVVWLGVGGDLDGLRALAATVEVAVVDAGLPGEQRELRPHLTLARVRRQVASAERRAIASLARELTPPPPEPYVASELVLVHSRLGAGGPRYEVLARF